MQLYIVALLGVNQAIVLNNDVVIASITCVSLELSQVVAGRNWICHGGRRRSH